MQVNKDFRFGILFNRPETQKILEISNVFNKSPEKFLSDIIDSTYEKIQILSLDWEDDD